MKSKIKLTKDQEKVYISVMYAILSTNDIAYNKTVEFLNAIPKHLLRGEIKFRANLVRKDARKYWATFKRVSGAQEDFCCDVFDEIEEQARMPIFQFYNACLFRLQKVKNDLPETIAMGETARVMSVTARNFARDAVEKFGMTAFRYIASARLCSSVEKLLDLVIKASNGRYTSFNDPDDGQKFSSVQIAYDNILHILSDFENIAKTVVRLDKN